ncbi:MAG TPA: hypothetical protein VKU62_14080, partial [Thermoanaerobaculia bacterium]|nr:hypothetical protein [Thermoanaerobaculia bacterium]
MADVRAQHALHRERRVRIALEIRTHIAAHEDVAVAADEDLRIAATRGIGGIDLLRLIETAIDSIAKKVCATAQVFCDPF